MISSFLHNLLSYQHLLAQSNLLVLLAFSLLVALVYYCVPPKWRVHILLVFSMVFYVACSGWMTLVLLGTMVWTWLCAGQLSRKDSTTGKRRWLIAGVLPLVAALVFFKYNGFFIADFQAVLAKFGITLGGAGMLLMPLGISYYTFKNISYLADVHLNKITAEKDFLKYATYVAFFPQITAGPIERYKDWPKTWQEKGVVFSPVLFRQGFSAICNGLFMKLVIANRLAVYTGKVFSQPDKFNGLTLCFAAFFYSIQLYCDFAGYSFLAIGLTNLLSHPCGDNFRRPYFAEDIREFWNRWHISLSSWLKDYVYIPLGGSRCTTWRKNVNLMITFLVSGAWHGVGLNFLVWGAWHGLLNVITPKRSKGVDAVRTWRASILHFGKVVLNFLLVALGWVFFASPNCRSAMRFLFGMFSRFSLSGNAFSKALLQFTGDNTSVSFFLVALLFMVIYGLGEWNQERKWLKGTWFSGLAWEVFLLVSVVFFGQFGGGFIYANF